MAAGMLLCGASLADAATMPFSGEGTEASPYLIQTAADLESMSALSAEGEVFSGKYFRMTADIDLAGSQKFQGININTNKKDAGFAGIFDGNGHTVNNMKMDFVVWTVEPTATNLGKIETSSTKIKQYTGFIGCLAETGVVRNLTIGKGSKLEVNAYSGAIVGYNYGTVENCVNYADIISYAGANVGGITGYAGYPSVVRNCVNAGSIASGNSYIGGIIGYNMGLISGCANTGNVANYIMTDNVTISTISKAGGITGFTYSRIENCINYATVRGNDYTGGIVGQLNSSGSSELRQPNDVKYNINAGPVFRDSQKFFGAIVAFCPTATKSEIVDNCWDKQIVLIPGLGNDTRAGMEGVETSVLTSGTPLEGYSAEAWDFSAGKYPAPKGVAGVAAIVAARAAVMTLPAGKTAWNMRGVTATLANGTGLSWSLSNNGFTLAGDKLTGPDNNTTLVADTLTVAAAETGFNKRIAVFSRQLMPLKGAGTAADPYMINNLDDWRNMARYTVEVEDSLTGKYLSLGAGLDFYDEEFVSLSDNEQYPFNGTFLGNGKLIEGIEIEKAAGFNGVFGFTGPKAVIKDVTVEGSVSVIGSALTGAFTPTFHGLMENCVNQMSLTSTHDNKSQGGKYVGGFAGKAFGEARFVNCTNKALIYGESIIGGFVGACGDSKTKISFEGCVNAGTVVSQPPTSSTVATAGFVGQAYPVTFVNCVNKGKVTTTKPSQCGGIAGFLGKLFTAAAVTDKYVFRNCRNEGEISGYNKIGGFTAEINSTIIAGKGIIEMDSCVNSGNINASPNATTGSNIGGILAEYTAGTRITDCRNTGNITAGKGSNIGGIAGSLGGKPATASYPVNITNCSNSGAISSNGGSIGGIVGYANAYVMIDSCCNTDSVSGAYVTGGIAGTVSAATTKISNSWNIGAVTGNNRLGGILGTCTTAKAPITDCWNGGNITSVSEKTGITGNDANYAIGGIAGLGASVFTRCFNVGTLKGMQRVGGIVGTPAKNNTQLTDCYNASYIDCPADSCGNIVGVNLENNGKMWTATNKITNCAYVTDFGNKAEMSDKSSIGLRAAELCALTMGEGVVKPAPDCYPIPATLAGNDATRLYAAAIVPDANNDIYSKISADFNIGVPQGASWSSSSDILEISGGRAHFTTPYSGEITLTGKLGEFTRTFLINANVVTVGIDDIIDDGDETTEWYDLQGLRVNNPRKGIYIRVRNGKAEKTIVE